MPTNFIGDNLLRLRRIKGLTQADIAKVLGIGQTAYSAWEKGKTKPPLDQLIRLASFFEVSLDELCGLNGDRSTSNPTQADIIKSILNLYDYGGATINIESIDVETVGYDGPETEQMPVVTITFNHEYDWLIEFIKAWSKLKDIEKSGLIKSDVVQAWVSEQLRQKKDFLPNGEYTDDLPF